MLVRNYSFRSPVSRLQMNINRNYFPAASRVWRAPLWFYQSNLSLGALRPDFLSSRCNQPYRPTWGWSTWNSQAGNTFGWWSYYSSWFWKPWSYRHPDTYYRPSYAVVDYILASTFETAWDARIDAAQEEVRQRYEDQILGAQTEQEAADLRAQSEAAAAQAAEEEARRAQEEAIAKGGTDTSTPPALSESDQEQLATQVETIADERSQGTPVSAAFEAALNNPAYLYLVSAEPDSTFDSAQGPCKLHIGDVLQQDNRMDGTGLVTMRVKVAQPTSCRTGSLITMSIPQLQEFYNAFQESMDAGAQELADSNQPGN
jgi:hypothetical protein